MSTMDTGAFDEVDLSSFEFWTKTPRQRDERFGVLRRERPISWQRPVEDGAGQRADSGGFWAVTRYADVHRGFRMQSTLLSGQGIFYEDVPEEANIGMSFICMDAPRHTQLRRLVSIAFTPRKIAELGVPAREQATKIVDELIESGPGDFVDLVSRKLPTAVIADMIGIEGEDRVWFSEKADDFANWNEPDKLEKYGVDHPGLVMVQTIVDMRAAFKDLADDHRRHPREDFVTALIDAEVEGQRLTDDEIGNFLCLLVAGGTDTTKQATSHSMLAFTDFPEARRALLDGVPGRMEGAVEEMLRWAHVANGLRRTAGEDVELGGQQIAKGEKVVLFIASANRDDEVFQDPWTFDITREPNRHISFGGGPHHCLGAALARMELGIIFDELFGRLPDIQAGPPEYVIGSHINGVRTLPCDF